MILEIRKFGDPVLRKTSNPIEKIDDKVLQLLNDMAETMYDAPGVGLAAPQVGVNLRAVVIDVDGTLRKIINPKIVGNSNEEEIAEEGCLSIPMVYEKVKRPMTVKVKYTNEKGEEVLEEVDGLLARAFQHEIDHLNGVVFVDKISSVAKSLIGKKLARMRKDTVRDMKSEAK